MSEVVTVTDQEQKALSQYIIPLSQPVVTLDCEVAFNSLDQKEKLYAHYLSQGCWYGGLAVAAQVIFFLQSFSFTVINNLIIAG